MASRRAKPHTSTTSRRAAEGWERDELISNLVTHLSQCDRGIQERMAGHLVRCDEDYGRRVAAGLGTPAKPMTVDGTTKSEEPEMAHGE
jgi:catalase